MNERTERKTIRSRHQRSQQLLQRRTLCVDGAGDSMMPEFEQGEIIVVEPSGLSRMAPTWWLL